MITTRDNTYLFFIENGIKKYNNIINNAQFKKYKIIYIEAKKNKLITIREFFGEIYDNTVIQ
jgi:Pyruvate/2-oxoacid:ferredoxin oxidoreductase gamma subunit